MSKQSSDLPEERLRSGNRKKRSVGPWELWVSYPFFSRVRRYRVGRYKTRELAEIVQAKREREMRPRASIHEIIYKEPT